jgi:hypothetical protein
VIKLDVRKRINWGDTVTPAPAKEQFIDVDMAEEQDA